MSNVGYITKSSDSPANTEFEEVVQGFPKFVRRMTEAFSGKTQHSFGDIVIDNTAGERDDWLERSWNGRSVVLKLGDPSWDYSDFRTVVSGVSAELKAQSSNSLVLKIRDKGILLDKQIQETLFTAGNNIDKPLPICYGHCKKVAPVLVEATTHTYQVHDGNIEAIDAVYDKGVSIAFTPDLINGTFTLTSQSAGQITADVRGAKFPGLAEGVNTHYNNIADIVYDIVKNRSDLTLADIDTTNFTTFKGNFVQPVGIYIQASSKISSVLDELVSSIGGYWGFSRNGLLTLGQLTDPAISSSTLTIASDDILEDGLKIKLRQLPRFKVTLGYERYWKIQTADQLAGSITEDVANDLSSEHRITVVEDSNVKTTHLLAHESALLKTLLTEQSDAATEANRRQVLRNKLRTTYIVDTFTAPFSVELGDVINIQHNRFGFDSGANAVVVGYSESITPPQIQLEVWR